MPETVMGSFHVRDGDAMARTRGSTADRGYGGPHQKLRASWKPQVDAGQVMCHAPVCKMPSRRIAPGEPWTLGHTPDRTAWTGPEHQKCGKSDGATRGNQAQPRQIKAAWSDATCRVCGKTYHYAARICQICGVHYHPSGASVRTCGRTCGVELRRKNGWTRRGPRANSRMPQPDVMAMIKGQARRARTAEFSTSRQW